MGFRPVASSSLTAFTSSTRERLSKDLEKSSTVIKRRKTEKLHKKKSVWEKLWKEGDKAATWRSLETDQTSYSLEEAVSLIIGSNLTQD